MEPLTIQRYENTSGYYTEVEIDLACQQKRKAYIFGSSFNFLLVACCFSALQYLLFVGPCCLSFVWQSLREIIIVNSIFVVNQNNTMKSYRYGRSAYFLIFFLFTWNCETLKKLSIVCDWFYQGERGLKSF